MDTAATRKFIEGVWDESIVPELIEYIKVPNKSPAFDADWQSHGYMQEAVALIEGWCREHALPGMSLEVVQLEGRTPLIFMDVPGEGEGCVLLYGHLDKQPEMTGWNEGYGPWTPVLDGERLYGRGGADDGYAMFASLTAINALHDQGVDHGRCVVLIEACEESGSFDLPYYIDALADRIGVPKLVVCLDSGCGNYDQMWCTTSLRGVVTGNLTVSLLREGVHSGDGSGIISSSFRVLRNLLNRLENEQTGEMLQFHVDIPEQRVGQAQAVADVLGDEVWDKFPLQEGVEPIVKNNTELILNRTWRPALSVTGARGMADPQDAGNVLRPFTTVKLSIRLPPPIDCDEAIAKLKQILEADPPYGAQVTFDHCEGGNGWDAPPLADWLHQLLMEGSNTYFGKDAVYMGEGGSIPFMGMLGEKFPEAQFMITGVLGPMSNAHGPNEFLDIPTAKRLTCCVAHVLAGIE